MGDRRDWMYHRKINGSWNPDFLNGLDNFIQYASSQPYYMSGDQIRCPCKKCDNQAFYDIDEVKHHLCRSGFVRDYNVWTFHGESYADTSGGDVGGSRSSHTNELEPNTYRTMVMDHAGPSFNFDNTEEPPNQAAQQVYDMLKAGDTELYPGCDYQSQLAFMTRFMSLKAENHLSEKCFNQFADFMQYSLPKGNMCPDNFYCSKKLLRGMGLPVEKIDCCPNNCMIYWGLYKDSQSCVFCSAPRYKDMCRASGSRRKKKVAASKMYYFPLTPRLTRLYMSNATAKDMQWHASSSTSDEGTMQHPAHSPAWKHLDSVFPDFAAEARNVRLGLSTDGFAPFAQSGRQYSSWPVILTPYNLPPWLCMKEQFMFLTVLVPGPHNPKMQLDVFLQPLIAELHQLWEVGVPTYDISSKQNFQMRAVLLGRTQGLASTVEAQKV